MAPETPDERGPYDGLGVSWQELTLGYLLPLDGREVEITVAQEGADREGENPGRRIVSWASGELATGLTAQRAKAGEERRVVDQPEALAMFGARDAQSLVLRLQQRGELTAAVMLDPAWFIEATVVENERGIYTITILHGSRSDGRATIRLRVLDGLGTSGPANR